MLLKMSFSCIIIQVSWCSYHKKSCHKPIYRIYWSLIRFGFPESTFWFDYNYIIPKGCIFMVDCFHAELNGFSFGHFQFITCILMLVYFLTFEQHHIGNESRFVWSSLSRIHIHIINSRCHWFVLLIYPKYAKELNLTVLFRSGHTYIAVIDK